MYSVILMTAMTAGAPEAPQFGWKARASACWGCAGACYGCGGACWGSGYGFARGGCGGACWGSGYGWSAGCTGAWGPARGYMVYPWGHVLPSYAAPVRVYGGDVWGANYIYSGSTPFMRLTPDDPPKSVDTSLGGSARLILEVPAGARVTVDGQATKGDAAVRRFYTPKLEEGREFYYDVRVELPAAGEPVTQTKRVYVRANQVVRESFRPGGGTTLANK